MYIWILTIKTKSLQWDSLIHANYVPVCLQLLLYTFNMPIYSLHFIKTLETRRIKRFPAKTFTNVGMVQRVIKNRVRAPTHHTGNKSPDTRGGPLPVWQSTTPAGHNSSPSRDFAYIAPRSTFSGFKSL